MSKASKLRLGLVKLSRQLHSNQPVFALLADCLQIIRSLAKHLLGPAADRPASESSEQELPAHSDSLDR